MIVAWNGRAGRGPSQRSQSRSAGGCGLGGVADPAGAMLLQYDGPRHGHLADRPRADDLGELHVQP